MSAVVQQDMIQPLSLKDAPALIERLLPVQKLSAEAYKEQMAHIGKTLTALGSYWKGRKPLILNKACILGCLLPATENSARDLQIFEMLLAMDSESFVVRSIRRPKPKEILTALADSGLVSHLSVEPDGILANSQPIDWTRPEYESVKVTWRAGVSELERRRVEAQLLPKVPYRELVDQCQRPEEVIDSVHEHIWDSVNGHLGTNARSLPELVRQLGIMRFGHRPIVSDTFCGSGQIPFEAARIGCDVHASDLSPIACMLTWGAFNIVGASPKDREDLEAKQRQLIDQVQAEIDRLGIETDGLGNRIKVLLYCAEVRCPQTGFLVPLLPTLVISKGYRVIAELVPDTRNKRYDINIKSGVSEEQLAAAEAGTVRSDGRGQDPYLYHCVGGAEYRTKISTLRGDFRLENGSTGNRLRLWDLNDFKPQPSDIFQERLYCIEWMRKKKSGKSFEYEFRGVTEDDLKRERIVEDFIAEHLAEWQREGWIPDMRIEPGEETERLSRERGWTHWHHLFNARQLLTAGLCMKFAGRDARLLFGVTQMLNVNARLSRWNNSRGGGGIVKGVFDNQALNTLYNYGCRGLLYASGFLCQDFKSFPFAEEVNHSVMPAAADSTTLKADILITDPPYGDAVKYEEIFEFFIAWLRKKPPLQFDNWIWDSRRSMAIKGENEDFRRGMVSAYKRMTENMAENGIQVIMFTHQSGSIWADMANIVWASGLQVTAAWYVVTETDNALREGSYVKGTVLLVLRKRRGDKKTTRDDLAWEIQEEVESQVQALVGLNQNCKDHLRDENVFEDADIQMAGYAAALRVLTRYAIIDGRDMSSEANRPRIKSETTFVDGLIAFAVDTANQCLVPIGIPKSHWEKLTGAERFYLKMLDMEARGAKTLDNYQNFAKAFKVRDFKPFLASHKANDARMKSSVEFGRSEMSEGSEFHQSALRAVLYALMELQKNIDGADVLAHLALNVPNYYSDMTQRQLVVEIADFIAKRLDVIRPQEASAGRIFCELIRNQRLG